MLASTTVDLYCLHYFHLHSSEVVQLVQFKFKYSISMENMTGKRSDPVRKIINIAQKTHQHCYTKLGKVSQKCHIQVPKKSFKNLDKDLKFCTASRS